MATPWDEWRTAHHLSTPGKMNTVQIAEQIQAHLRRLEKDPEINKLTGVGLAAGTPFSYPTAEPTSRGVWVQYTNRIRPSFLKTEKALEYLTRLNEGFAGKHWEIGEG